jgi:hypothetical protein
MNDQPPLHAVWWKPSTGEVVAVAELDEPINPELDEPVFTISDLPPDTVRIPPCTSEPGCDADMHMLCCPSPERADQ